LNYTRWMRADKIIEKIFSIVKQNRKKIMEIFLNGHSQQVEDGLNISRLIKELHLENKMLAVEINLEIVPRSQFDSLMLSAGDKVEIVRAIGGG